MRFGLPVSALIAGCAWLGSGWAAASVYVTALAWGRADVRIDGSEPRSMWVGDTSPEGVSLRSVGEDAAVFEIDGRLWTLKAGQGTYSQTTLRANDHGQFFLTARVNGAPLPAIIDTGATSVAMKRRRESPRRRLPAGPARRRPDRERAHERVPRHVFERAGRRHRSEKRPGVGDRGRPARATPCADRHELPA